jgi:hypothetical protein
MRWKWLCITPLALYPNRSSPIDSAEEPYLTLNDLMVSNKSFDMEAIIAQGSFSERLCQARLS